MQRGLHPQVRGREGSDVRHLEANADLHLQWQWSPFYKGYLESCWTKDTMGSNMLTYIQHLRMISIAAKIPGSWKYPWHFVGRFWQKLLSGPQGTARLVVLWHRKMCGKVLRKEHVIRPCLSLMEETAAPEHLNTRLLAKRWPVVALLLLPVSLNVMPVACAGVQRA